MITPRPAKQRGHTDLGWLDSYHSFSFGEYHDPAHMGFRSLRVMNDDRVAPGMGFGTHPHRDMEIVTWVLEGELAHKDSLGSGSTISPGELQRMSAGTGIAHSEFNPSADREVRLLQIWILPDKRGRAPEYEQKRVDGGAGAAKSDGLKLIASPDGRGGTVTIHQDVAIYRGRLARGGAATHQLARGRAGWVQVTAGAVSINGTELHDGDGAAITDERELKLGSAERGEFLLFDLA